MHRFFVPDEAIRGDAVFFSKSQSHQIAKVLRMSPGQVLEIFTSQGDEYEVSLSDIEAAVAVGTIQKTLIPQAIPEINVQLFISPIKHDHFDFVLQKCTEIGIQTFTPVISSRTIVNLSNWDKKIQRWKKIIIEASEQSRRNSLPELLQPMSLSQSFEIAKNYDRCYIAWENEKSLLLIEQILRNPLPPLPTIGLYIGPEGGYSSEEILLAEKANIIPVSLGDQVLRSETAAIVGCSLIMNILRYLGSARK